MIINQLLWPFLFWGIKASLKANSNLVWSVASCHRVGKLQKKSPYFTLIKSLIFQCFNFQIVKIEINFLARKFKYRYFRKKVARFAIRNVVKNETFLSDFQTMWIISSSKSNTKYGDFNWSESILYWTWPVDVVRQLLGVSKEAFKI